MSPRIEWEKIDPADVPPHVGAALEWLARLDGCRPSCPECGDLKFVFDVPRGRPCPSCTPAQPTEDRT